MIKLRLGIFRLLDLLRKHGLKPTVAMDVLSGQNYPFLVRYCQSQGCEINVPSSGVCFNRPSEEDPTLWPSDHAGVWADLDYSRQ